MTLAHCTFLGKYTLTNRYNPCKQWYTHAKPRTAIPKA